MKKLIIIAMTALFVPLAMAADPAKPGPTPMPSADTVEAAEAAFARIDKNKDGSLDTAEATANGVHTDRFKSLDSNADNRVSKREYVAAQVKSSTGQFEEPAS